MDKEMKSKRILIKAIPERKFSSVRWEENRISFYPVPYPFGSRGLKGKSDCGLMDVEYREGKSHSDYAILLLTKDKVRKDG